MAVPGDGAVADDGGEHASVFEAVAVPVAGTSSTALSASVVQAIHAACTDAPPHGAGGYLWHREPPRVAPLEDVGPGAVHVSMRVQDAVEDEWFMAYILRKLTRSVPGLCVQVSDEDGEFLLIEAADALPKWITPENAANRVWLYEGDLHLVPLAYTTPHPDDDVSLSVGDAVALVRDATVPTQAPAGVQTAAFARLDVYPAAASRHQHRTLAVLPNKAACLLQMHPQLVAEAVHALSTRDVVSSRTLQRTGLFPIVPTDGVAPAENTALVPVKMTRYLYAQLAHDRFFPPKAYGRRWQEAVENYRLHTSGDSNRQARVSEEAALYGRWCDTGAKLTAGLELVWEALQQRAAPGNTAEDAREEFLASLAALGYFGDEVRGSARWTQLAEEASAMASVSTSPDAEAARELHALRTTLDGLADDVRPSSTLAFDRPTEAHMTEDGEGWLAEVPDVLQTHPTADGAEDHTVDRLGTFMTKMNAFLQGEGDVDGALFDDEDFQDGDEPESETDDELVEPVPLSEWGAENAKAAREHAQAGESAQAAAPAAPEPTPPAVPQAPHRLQGFTSQEHYEGDSDSDGSLQGDEHDPAEERKDRHAHLDLDDTPREPAVDDGIHMENELGDFLAFTQKTLGLSDEQYAGIMQDRRGRGGRCLLLTQRMYRGMRPPRQPRLCPRRRMRSWTRLMRCLLRWRRNSPRSGRTCRTPRPTTTAWTKTSWTKKTPSCSSTYWLPAHRSPRVCSGLRTRTA